MEPAPVVRNAAGQFAPGTAKLGGRGVGVPNRDRRLSIDRIMATADPVGFLCRIVNGEETDVTMADRIAAAKVLCAKVMPDLRQVSVDDNGTAVTVLLQLARVGP